MLNAAVHNLHAVAINIQHCRCLTMIGRLYSVGIIINANCTYKIKANKIVWKYIECMGAYFFYQEWHHEINNDDMFTVLQCIHMTSGQPGEELI